MFHQASSHPCRFFPLVSKGGTLQQDGAAKPCVLLTKTGAGRPQTFQKPGFCCPPCSSSGTERCFSGKQSFWGNIAAWGSRCQQPNMCKGWRDVWSGSTGMKNSDGKAAGCKGSRKEHEFHWDMLDWWLTWGCESFSLSNSFPDEGNNSQGRPFDWILPSHSGADEMPVLARHSALLLGWTCFCGKTFWQLAVGLGHFFLWEQEFKQAGAPGGRDRRCTWLQADWLCFCFPQHPVLGQPSSLLHSSVLS